ncbi:hypothetical protein [Rhabdochlamydiaceae symbiont of Dictyostelium giganteum]|uniref:hypothetical protein n=1 Tax=Rhabdochlamydiaceae symbiont of Dictyostelium giganteum TaxID=3342349 RepID=UPI003850CEA1
MINFILKTASYLTPAYCSSGVEAAKYLMGKSQFISSTDKKIAAAAVVAFAYPTAVAIFNKITGEKSSPFLSNILPLINPLAHTYKYSVGLCKDQMNTLSNSKVLSTKWNVAAIKLLAILFLTGRPAWTLGEKITNKFF